MKEIDILGRNAETFPQLHVWGWEIALYLFLGGLAAGLLVLSGLAWRKGGNSGKATDFWGPLLAPVVLAIGMGALFLDLEKKAHVWRFYTTVQWRSPMSWGSWILLLVMPAALWMAWLALTDATPGLRRTAGTMNAILGTALGIYTGVLLGAMGARPLWNSPLMGPLFLMSGLSAAAALLYLLESDEGEKRRLASLDLRFMAVEAALLALLFGALFTGGEAQRAAARLFFGGPYTAVFWIGVVFVGMILPALFERREHRGWAPLWVLMGSMALRAVMVWAGQASQWEVL
jgi:protein NrfD